MENRYNVSIANMIPIITATVNSGGSAEMNVTGNSMKPLLKDRASSVKLAKPDNLRIGDIVLFRRDTDHYVLHRIIDIHAEHDITFDILGDNQAFPDMGIARRDIIAKVVAYNRSGKIWRSSDDLYRLMLPMIRKMIRIRRKLIRAKKSFQTCL